ncbi:hypothetical protein Hanom_Chr00s004632g01724261 [Helianthus anomalus]
MDDSDGNSEDGGSKVGCNMEDEVEDGEIRSPIHKSPVPEVVPRSPPESPSIPVDDRSQENVTLDTERLHEVHGIPTILKEVINESEIPEKVAAGATDGGPRLEGLSVDGLGSHDKSVNGSGPVDQLLNDGPTPIFGLGKRSREDRSPPSSGSMQGPPIRGFHHYPLPGELSFDLNNPASEHMSSRGAPAGGNLSYHSEVNMDEESLGDEQSKPSERLHDHQPEPGDPDSEILKEVRATVDVGSKVGVDLRGFEEAARVIVLGEGEPNNLR